MNTDINLGLPLGEFPERGEPDYLREWFDLARLGDALRADWQPEIPDTGVSVNEWRDRVDRIVEEVLAGSRG